MNKIRRYILKKHQVPCMVAAHFRFCSKRGKCERKPFGLKPTKEFKRSRRTISCASHFLFRSKRGQCERKPFRLEPKNSFTRNRRTLVPRGQTQYKENAKICIIFLSKMGKVQWKEHAIQTLNFN